VLIAYGLAVVFMPGLLPIHVPQKPAMPM